jgi:hypothetical protein
VLAVIGSGQGDMREAKILELFKKVRTLIACVLNFFTREPNDLKVELRDSAN